MNIIIALDRCIWEENNRTNLMQLYWYLLWNEVIFNFKLLNYLCLTIFYHMKFQKLSSIKTDILLTNCSRYTKDRTHFDPIWSREIFTFAFFSRKFVVWSCLPFKRKEQSHGDLSERYFSKPCFVYFLISLLHYNQS
jgi:hypothetical protein